MGNPKGYRVVEIRPGAKGRRWTKRVAWNQDKRSILRNWRRMVERQVGPEELVRALGEVGKPGRINEEMVEAVEKKIVEQWKIANRLRRQIKRSIPEGIRVGENVQGLKNQLDQLVGENGFIPMTNGLLVEFIGVWSERPETRKTIAHIKRLREIRRNPEGKNGKRRKKRGH